MLFRFVLAYPRDHHVCIESCGSLPFVIVEDCYSILLSSSHYARGNVTVLDRFRSNYDFRFVSAGAASLRPLPQFVDCHFLSWYLHVPPCPPLGGPTCCLGHRYRPEHKSISLPPTYLGHLLPSVKCTLYLPGTHASARLDSVGLWPDLRLVLCSLSFAYWRQVFL